MKITYLINKTQEDGIVRLSEADRAEWLIVVTENRNLPPAERRHFIYDYIAEDGDLDCIIMEAPVEMRNQWLRDHAASQRNRKLGKNYQTISLDALLFDENEPEQIHHCLAGNESAEDAALENLMLEELRTALAGWKHWAVDLLDLYLSGERRSCTAFLAGKYGVSLQVARKYKRQFEEFTKKFLSGVSF